MPPITWTSSGGLIYLMVASGCHDGASVTLSPRAGSIVKAALASDHKDAAVVILPREKKFTIVVTGRQTFDVRVDLT